jgi:hypothetical protein
LSIILLIASGLVGSILEIIAETSAVIPRFKVSDHFANRTHYYLCFPAATPYIPSHR